MSNVSLSQAGIHCNHQEPMRSNSEVWSDLVTPEFDNITYDINVDECIRIPRFLHFAIGIEIDIHE